MPKKCQAPDCDRDVFSNNYCQVHSYMRTDKKWLKSLLKQHKKGNTVIKSKPAKDKKLFPFKDQIDVFKYVWETNPHVCWLTGVPINFAPLSSQWISSMAHVLRKGTYTYFKLNPDNIRILQPMVHDLVDNFRPQYRKMYDWVDFDKWFRLQDDMRIEYEIFKRENLLA